MSMKRIRPSDLKIGFLILLKGIKSWLIQPKVMLLGILPAFLVGIFFFILLLWAIPNMYSIASWITPFADSWDLIWSESLRITLGIAFAVGLAAFCLFSYVGVTLTVGAPFYQRVWLATENSLEGFDSQDDDSIAEGSLVRGFAEAIRLALMSLKTAFLAFLIGLVPVFGATLASIFVAVRGTRSLALELTSFSGEPRGFSLAERQKLISERPLLLVGSIFPIYLALLLPILGVLAMPIAVVSATYLFRELLTKPAEEEDLQDEEAPYDVAEEMLNYVEEEETSGTYLD